MREMMKAMRMAMMQALFGAMAVTILVFVATSTRGQVRTAASPPFPIPTVTPTPVSPAAQIQSKYAAMGGATGVLGPATSPISRTADGAGYYQHYQNGSIYWTAATSVHETHGDIWRKYNSLGGPAALGYPVTDELSAPCGGRYSDFKKGSLVTSVYWKAGIGAFETHGLIKAKYLEFGGPCALGYPTTDETATKSDPAGRYNHFSNGYSIYWKPATGAHEVHGAIRDKYLALGGPDGFLGFPCTDVTVTGAWALGRYSNFENGAIYWTAQTGAHEVHGAIRERWQALGGVGSWLGYPLTDELQVFGFSGYGRYNKFQGGYVYYYPDTDAFATTDLAGVVYNSLKLKPSLGTRKVLAILWDPGRPND
ncbi:MAG: LGFP repeat-containing protein, partial [Blastocatellia bacterium]